MDVEIAAENLLLSGQPPERQREGLETVFKLLSNIQKNPHEAKYRQIRLTAPAIQKRLFFECVGFLFAAGFEEEGELLLYRKDASSPVLTETMQVVETLILSLGGSVGGGGGPSSSSSSSPAAAAAASSSSSSSRAAAAASSRAAIASPASPASAAATPKRTPQQMRADRQREEQRKAKSSAQDQLAALRQQRKGQYQEQQDQALARHLSGRNADQDFDAISALNASRGATQSIVSCTRCGTSLRYNSNTRAQMVLCPCGQLLQPVALQGQAFQPMNPSDLPVEPGEPMDQDDRPRAYRGHFIYVRTADGERQRLPLHSVLSMVRQHESRQQAGAQDDTIEALPTRTYQASADGAASGKKEDCNCQICMEDFQEGDELRTLPCFHLFHAKCVDQWLRVNSICPTCRHKID